jgi:hypothetical protein
MTLILTLTLNEALKQARQECAEREARRQAAAAAERERNQHRTRRMWEAVQAGIPQIVGPFGAQGVLICDDCDDGGILDPNVEITRVWVYLNYHEVAPFYLVMCEDSDGTWVIESYGVPWRWEAKWDDGWCVVPTFQRYVGKRHTSLIDALATAMEQWEGYAAAKLEMMRRHEAGETPDTL